MILLKLFINLGLKKTITNIQNEKLVDRIVILLSFLSILFEVLKALINPLILKKLNFEMMQNLKINIDKHSYKD